MVHQQNGGNLKALATHLSATDIKKHCLRRVRYFDQRRGGTYPMQSTHVGHMQFICIMVLTRKALTASDRLGWGSTSSTHIYHSRNEHTNHPKCIPDLTSQRHHACKKNLARPIASLARSSLIHRPRCIAARARRAAVILVRSGRRRVSGA